MRTQAIERADRSLVKLFAVAAITLLTLAVVGAAGAGNGKRDKTDLTAGAVYAMTNDAAGNEVLAYERDDDGSLSLQGTYSTDGEGTSRIRLSSQGPVVLTEDGQQLLVANVGSSEISVFDIRRNSLKLRSIVPSGGSTPNSITVRGDLVYVLNNGLTGLGNITGFRLTDKSALIPIAGSTRPLSAAGSDPAQVSFTPDGDSLVVTEKATNRILTWGVGEDGLPFAGEVHASDGVTPFGFDFTRDGTFVVTNAEEGIVGAATASSYTLEGGFRTISGSVPDFRSEVCWTVISKDQRYAYITNFGDGTISSYTIARDGSITLLESIAATTTFGQLSIRDAGRSKDGRFLYAIDITSRMVHGWEIEDDGSLTSIGAFPGLPGTVAGLAAR